ncbi:MAG: fumarylacetoacetate hydrolase family protein, partial [Microvirga sp.]
MRLALFETPGDGGPRLGAAVSAGIVPVDLMPGVDGAVALRETIARFSELRVEIESAVAARAPIPLDQVVLLPPVASPSKLLCVLRRLGPSPDHPVDLQVFLRARGAALGSGGEIVLPELDGADLFTQNACLGVVIGGPTRSLAAADWREAVFGYTGMIDIAPRTQARVRWKGGPGPMSPIGSSCDSFAPLGPWIVPRAEVDDREGLRLRLRCGTELRQDERLEDLDHWVGAAIERASSVMTLRPGDIVAIDGSL